MVPLLCAWAGLVGYPCFTGGGSPAQGKGVAIPRDLGCHLVGGLENCTEQDQNQNHMLDPNLSIALSGKMVLLRAVGRVLHLQLTALMLSRLEAFPSVAWGS